MLRIRHGVTLPPVYLLSICFYFMSGTPCMPPVVRCPGGWCGRTRTRAGRCWVIITTMVCLAGLEVAEEGVLVCRDYNGRPSGEAFVELTCEEDIEKAVEKHNESMGHRWGHSLGRGCVVLLVRVLQVLDGYTLIYTHHNMEKAPIKTLL